MEFFVLGPLLVRSDGEAAVGIGAAKPRAVLGVLLVNVNRVVSVDRLLEEVWGDDVPKGGAKTLRYHVSKLRDVLSPGRRPGEEGPVATVPSGYVLRLEADQLDAWRFEALTGEGSAALEGGRFGFAGERLAEALDLWRGGAFQDFAYDDFARGEIARLEELRLVCLEDRVATDLAGGRHREVLPELQGLVREFPLRERFWSQLMVALTDPISRPRHWAPISRLARCWGNNWGSSRTRRCDVSRSRSSSKSCPSTYPGERPCGRTTFRRARRCSSVAATKRPRSRAWLVNIGW
jgi:DNA-binding SARP family transcriptional activator